MKYNDRHTRLLSRKWDGREAPDPYDVHRNKLIKQFSKQVLQLGFDPDWWSLVSKDDRWNLYSNCRFLKNFDKTDKTTLGQFISNNKPKIKIDEARLRDMKISKILK